MYPDEVMNLARMRGWTALEQQAHAIACTEVANLSVKGGGDWLTAMKTLSPEDAAWLDRSIDVMALSHPSNYLTEEEAERYFG